MLWFWLLIGFFSISAQAQPTALFSKGAETFRIVDRNQQTPTFHLLNSSLAKRSLAIAVNSALKLPEPAGQPAVDVRLEKLTLKPQGHGSDKVSVTLQASGRSFPLDTTVSKSALLSGQAVNVTVPAEEDELAMVTVTSRGRFTLRFDAAQNRLVISGADARFDIASPLAEEEPEHIQFSGEGLRQ